MTIQILDIFADNKFDADAEKATGTDGVIIKAGQGQYAEYFARKCNYIDECKRVGLPWGVYWVVDARYSPESQKAAIKAKFKTQADFGPLGMWLDCEKPTVFMTDWMYSKLPYAYYKPIESIAQMILQTYGKQPGIYTSPGAWKLIFGACPKTDQDWFAQAPLWTAQYGVKSPTLYGSWKAPLMWQYQESPDYSVADETAWAAWLNFGVAAVPTRAISEADVKFSDGTHTVITNPASVIINGAQIK